MTVHVDLIESEVVVEPTESPTPAEGQQTSAWEELARHAALGARLRRDDLRTRAQGYDD